MPRWKYVANRFLTTIENRIMGTHLSEAHTGYRAYSRDLLLTVPFLRNSLDFTFDSELLMQAAHFGFRIKEVPGPLPLLRGRLLGRVQSRRRLRAEDALGRRSAAAPPLAGSCRRASSSLDGLAPHGRPAPVARAAQVAHPLSASWERRRCESRRPRRSAWRSTP